MLWKIGCGTALLGIALSVSSCALFGTAFHKAMERHQAAERLLPQKPGDMVSAEVEAGTAAQIEVRATVTMPDSVWAAPDVERARIREATLPVHFRVFDAYGETLESGAGTMHGNTIVPSPDSPSWNDFDGRIEVTYQSTAFELGESSNIGIEIDLDRVSSQGWPVDRGRVRVYDRVPTSSKRFALGGLASFFLGPLVAGIGMLLFVIGLITRKRTA